MTTMNHHSDMKLENPDYSMNIVAVGAMARELQKKSAKPFNDAEVYKIATDLIMECQEIRRKTNQPRKLIDYIKRVVS